MTTNRKSEGAIVSDIRWQGNTISNDRDVLKAKGINGLKKSEAYAVATSKVQKLEVWFRSKQRLDEWRKTVNQNEWNIKLIKR